MLNKTLIVIGVVGVLSACSKKEKPLFSTDAGLQPLRVSIDGPPYLATNVAPDTRIELSFISPGLELDVARQKIVSSVVIENYPGQKPVQGSWAHQSWTDSLTFQPASPLSVGDYVVRFPNAGGDFVVSRRPYNVFRVGSALRLAQIELLRDKQSSSFDLVRVVLHFSEPVPTSESVGVQVDVAAGPAWVRLGMTQEGNTAAKLAKPIDPSVPVRFSVSTPNLDGMWSGIAGSGPVTAEFVPKEFTIEAGQVLFPVPPDLSIELPSGRRRP